MARKFERFHKDEKGVSVVLGALLVLGIITLFFSLWYPRYIESSLHEKESNAMNEIKNKFQELQEKISWIEGEGEGGIIRFPMGAVSVRLFAGRSPSGTLTVTPGKTPDVNDSDGGGGGGGSSGELVNNGTFESMANWENKILEDLGNDEAKIEYDSTEGGGSIRGYVSSKWRGPNTDPSEIEAYWYQEIGPANPGETITLNGSFKKEINGGENGMDYASVSIELEDGEDNWIPILENNTIEATSNWVGFPETDYTVSNGVDNIRCYVHARTVDETPGGAATVSLWMDNVSAKVPGGGNGSEGGGTFGDIVIDPGLISIEKRNLYYPDQTYVFEGGHVILFQDGSEKLIEKDSSFLNLTGNTAEINYPLISGERSSISSTGSESVNLSYSGGVIDNGSSDNLTISISTDYENAWAEYFREETKNITYASTGIKNGTPYVNIVKENLKYSILSENIKAEI